MLPTRKFNELPVVTNAADASTIFCIVDGVDSLVTIDTLRVILGVSSNDMSLILVSTTYSGLFALEDGSEYYEAPYIYKRITTGVVRISTDTSFTIPTGYSVGSGFVVGSYGQLLSSFTSYEYHELPYIYKKHQSGVFRIPADTDFTVPSGSGLGAGVVVDTYANLLTSNYGFEYHEMPYVYKQTPFGVIRINPDTEFDVPPAPVTYFTDYVLGTGDGATYERTTSSLGDVYYKPVFTTIP